MAVTDHLLSDQEPVYGPVAKARSAHDWIERIVECSLTYLGSSEHIAMLAIKLALKHQPTVRERVGARLEALEAANDRAWVTALRQTGRPREELTALRRMLAATTRGLARLAASINFASVSARLIASFGSSFPNRGRPQ